MAIVDAERWKIISGYLDTALALGEAERTAWLEALDGAQPALARQLRTVLDEHRLLVQARFLDGGPSRPTVPAASPGQTLGTYTLVAPLGQGGMGTVWLAERSDGRFERRAAVKFLNLPFGDDRSARRFQREGTILARLTHPNIAQLLDAGVTASGQPYLVLEHVDGEPIDAHCDRLALDVRARVRLLVDALDAVAHAHANLIVHRDLKPSNILVDRSGSPKLLDFGISRMVDAATPAALTQERLLTPAYASPEQMHGEPPATSSDIYSLGAVLYCLLTGRPPYVDDAASDRVRHEPPPARALNPSVPADLDCIVRQALRPEPQERYGSVEALRADLVAFLESRPVQARSGNVWYHARRFVRRHWAPLGATTLIVLSLAAALVVVERARTNADRRFGQLQQLATRVLDLDRDIRGLSGSTAARHELVSISLEYLEGLAADARNDLDLARQLGVAYHRVARVQGVPVVTNLGQWRAAEASLKKADVLMTSVLASRPTDRIARFESAGIAHDLVVVTESERRDIEALAWARTAIARIERLIASGDVTGDQRRQLTRYASNVALALVNMHRYAEAIPVVRRVVEATRSDPSAAGQLASGLSLLASALRYQGDLDGALRAVREARAIAERTATSGLTERMFVLYGPLLREGMILGEEGGVNLGRPEEAVEPLQRALDVTEVVAKADPNDSTSRARVGTSARQLANIVRATDPRRAAAIYDVALTRLREIPNNVGARRSEAMTLAESCYALRAIGRPAEASRRMARALALLGETRDYPGAAVTLDGPVETVLRAQADSLAAGGDLHGAIAGYVRLIDAVTSSRPAPEEDLPDAAGMSRLYGTLAGLHHRAGNEADAVAVAARRTALWQHWDRQLPGNTFVRRQLASR